MVTLRRAFLASLLLMLGACATIPDITQSRSPCRMQAGGWCDFVREAAKESYPYAIASASAYQGDDDIYPDDKLGVSLVRRDRLKIDNQSESKGFDYQIFDHYKVWNMPAGLNGKVKPVASKLIGRIVAFRGTDLGSKDVFFGSLRKDQIDIAKRYFDLERARPEAAHIKNWAVTGHSLGGALATEVSAQFDDVPAYMFNTSPFLKIAPTVNDANRTVINERGDWLGEFRKFDEAPAARLFVLNCSPQKGRFTKHKIKRLADCITWIAAYDSHDALKVVKDNAIEKPPVECNTPDGRHPGPEYHPTIACVHMVRGKDKQ